MSENPPVVDLVYRNMKRQLDTLQDRTRLPRSRCIGMLESEFADEFNAKKRALEQLFTELTTKPEDDRLVRGLKRRSIAGDIDAFWSRVAKQPDGCWLWQGSKSRSGYGVAIFDGRGSRATWISWLLHNGPVPRGMFMLHKCDNPPCVNPEHLFVGTGADNMRAMAAKGRGAMQRPEMHPKGEAHPNALLTDESVVTLRERYASGEPTSALCAEFGIGKSALSFIVLGITWSHLGGPRTNRRNRKLKVAI
jgi:hypothetical protein